MIVMIFLEETYSPLGRPGGLDDRMLLQTVAGLWLSFWPMMQQLRCSTVMAHQTFQPYAQSKPLQKQTNRIIRRVMAPEHEHVMSRPPFFISLIANEFKFLYMPIALFNT